MKLPQAFGRFAPPGVLLGALLVLLFALIPAHVHAQGSAPSSALIVLAGQHMRDSIATTDRDVIIEGEVLGDVTTWSGNIAVAGHVSGDVISYSGDVTLDARARIDGNVLTVAGAVTQPPRGKPVAGALISGTIGGNAVSSLFDAFTPAAASADIAASTPLRAVIYVALLGMLLMLSTFSALLWPRRTAGASRTFVVAPWRSLALGTLTTIIFAVLLLPATALVAMTLVGLPLLLPLLLLLHLPYVYGLAALGQALGRALRAVAPERATALGVLVVLLPLAFLGILAPSWSVLLLYLVAGTGLGAVIISRGGTLALG